MRLHDLRVGQRFTFTDKYRGKVFEVTDASHIHIAYMDVATGDQRTAPDNRKTFSADVRPVTDNRLVELTPLDIEHPERYELYTKEQITKSISEGYDQAVWDVTHFLTDKQKEL